MFIKSPQLWKFSASWKNIFQPFLSLCSGNARRNTITHIKEDPQRAWKYCWINKNKISNNFNSRQNSPHVSTLFPPASPCTPYTHSARWWPQHFVVLDSLFIVRWCCCFHFSSWWWFFRLKKREREWVEQVLKCEQGSVFSPQLSKKRKKTS